jgi:hypothetical protein
VATAAERAAGKVAAEAAEAAREACRTRRTSPDSVPMQCPQRAYSPGHGLQTNRN